MSSFWTPNGEHTFGGSKENDSEVLGRMSREALQRGADGPAEESPEAREMKFNRRVNGRLNKQGMGGAGGGAGGMGLSFATGRPRDPMFYWKQNNLPYDIWREDELLIIRHYCRLLYLTHPMLASAIDIFAKYPLQGMELTCKDDQLTDFYSTLFLEDLDYEEYLTDVLHEYWTVGEAWPLGQWNDRLGIWEDDELLNPDDIDVIKSPFIKQPRFEMRLPEQLRKILKEREPKWEYDKLVKQYPELLHFLADDARMPVSNVLLKQIKFKADTFHPRGIPILMRGFRSIFQEEMLNAAQDAIASRLYTPLILAKLGASATDLGTSVPWIPTAADLGNFEESLDEALSGDFRVLTHHFALEMESVFGKESMPELSGDFERLEGRQLQIFGMSKTMLSGAGDGETYAADALNLDIMSQLLGRAQKLAKGLYKERAEVVAEAQEHYDYEERNGMKYQIMEEVLEVDEETGEEKIVEQPKLLTPDMNIKSMDLKEEAERRQLIEDLRDRGVPISIKTRLVNIPIEFDDELEQSKEEAVKIAENAAETRKQTYMTLMGKGLPIPADLKEDFEPKARDVSIEDEEQASADQGFPAGGNIALDPPAPGAAIAPNPEDYAAAEQAEEAGDIGPNEGAGNAEGPPPVVIPLPQQAMRPAESDERRANMPKPAVKQSVKLPGDYEVYEDKEVEVQEGRHHLLTGPTHIGRKRPVRDPNETDS